MTFVDSGLDEVFPPALSRRRESTVIVLPFRPANDWASFCPEYFEVPSQARPAAFEDAGGGPATRPPEALGGFDGLFPSLAPLKVVSITCPPFFSGLGVLEVFLGGTGRVGDEYVGGVDGGTMELMRELLYDLSDGASESLCARAGRLGSGGGGFEKSG